MAKAATAPLPPVTGDATGRASAAPTATKKPERKLAVIDNTCEPGHDGSTPKAFRIHTVLVNGRETPVKFKYGEATVLDFPIGMKFLKLPEFDVRDPQSGTKLEPIADPLKRVIGHGEELAADQIIARLDELTLPALLMRSASLDGGERFGTNSAPGEVIAFLLDQTRARAKAAAAAKKPAVAVMDEASAPDKADTLGGDDFDRMFPGEGE